MKLLKAFLVSLAWNFSMSISLGNDNLATAEPWLQYGRVGNLYIQLSKMGPQRRVALKQQIKNHSAAKLREVINHLIAGQVFKGPKTQRKSPSKSQRKRNNRFNRYIKYHNNWFESSLQVKWCLDIVINVTSCTSVWCGTPIILQQSIIRQAQ